MILRRGISLAVMASGVALAFLQSDKERFMTPEFKAKYKAIAAEYTTSYAVLRMEAETSYPHIRYDGHRAQHDAAISLITKAAIDLKHQKEAFYRPLGIEPSQGVEDHFFKDFDAAVEHYMTHPEDHAAAWSSSLPEFHVIEVGEGADINDNLEQAQEARGLARFATSINIMAHKYGISPEQIKIVLRERTVNENDGAETLRHLGDIDKELAAQAEATTQKNRDDQDRKIRGRLLTEAAALIASIDVPLHELEVIFDAMGKRPDVKRMTVQEDLPSDYSVARYIDGADYPQLLTLLQQVLIKQKNVKSVIILLDEAARITNRERPSFRSLPAIEFTKPEINTLIAEATPAAIDAVCEALVVRTKGWGGASELMQTAAYRLGLHDVDGTLNKQDDPTYQEEETDACLPDVLRYIDDVPADDGDVEIILEHVALVFGSKAEFLDAAEDAASRIRLS